MDRLGLNENYDLKKGHIVLTGSKQDYDLQDIWASVSESNRRIEVQRVFNHIPSSITRFYDPYAVLLTKDNCWMRFGFGNVSPAISFILKPISYDLLEQMGETSDLVRKSAYSFELHNNNLRIFPRPLDGDTGSKIYFEYYVKDDVRNTNNENAGLQGGVSDPSNVPYQFITYNSINATW